MDLALSRKMGEGHVIEDDGFVYSFVEEFECIEVSNEEDWLGQRVNCPSGFSASSWSNHDNGSIFDALRFLLDTVINGASFRVVDVSFDSILYVSSLVNAVPADSSLIVLFVLIEDNMCCM